MPQATMVEIARNIAARIDWNGEIVIVPDEAQPPAKNTAQHLVGDSSRIRQELDYAEVTPPDEAWEREGDPPLNPAEFDYEAEDELLRKYG
jgi:hypothetical protein